MNMDCTTSDKVIRGQRRKTCNKCSHFKYGVNPKNNRGCYYCEVTGKYAGSYYQQKYCDYNNKDIDEIEYIEPIKKHVEHKKDRTKYELISYKQISDVVGINITANALKKTLTYDYKAIGNGKLYIRFRDRDKLIVDIKTTQNANKAMTYKVVSKINN